MQYEPTIGLEIHAELKTQTKMFCHSRNDANETNPNVNICPVCLAHPGTLPVINKEAVRHVLRVGVALGAKIADYTEFDRKNYFYPDLPKGYQLSQYAYPLVSGGELSGVTITRIHLEEDTASSLHDDNEGVTAIDYNRAGVPLMELVTEPVIKSAEKAGEFARELQLLLRYLGVSDANMEKGEMRVEANVSVAEEGKRASTYVEIKNLNSFRAMERAVAYEIERQKRILEEGGVIIKETLGWDEGKQATFPQRVKEGSADYRYFPDPDLPSLRLSEIADFSINSLKSSLPELPSERRSRYKDMGIREEDAQQYANDPGLGDFFDWVAKGLTQEQKILASNYIANDLVSSIRGTAKRDTEYTSHIGLSPEHFRELIKLISAKSISSRAGKDILIEMVSTNQSPERIAKNKSLFQTSESHDLAPIVEQLLQEHANVVEDYKRGKDAAMKFLIGQGMKISKGAGNPEVIREMLLEKIKNT